MEISQKENTLFFNGELNFENAECTIKKIKKLQFNQDNITINCGNILNAASVSLAVLIETLSLLKKQNKTVQFVDVPEHIQTLARVSQLSELFEG